MPKKPSKKIVDNVKFTAAVIEYSEKVHAAKAADKDPPQITNYIGKSILDLCNGIAARPNFSKYSFRDQMILDAVEDCIKAISRGNYDKSAATRSKKPNAFGYFSQVAFWAMVRRIQKEEKEVEKRINLINSLAVEHFIADADADARQAIQTTINRLQINNSERAKKKDKAKTKHYGWSAPQSRGKKAKQKEPAVTLETVLEDSDT